MRSNAPDPTNPWPHDMELRVARATSGMLTALAVAEAWRIDLGIPQLDPPPVGVVVGDRPVDAARVALTTWRDAVAVTGLPDGHVRGLALDGRRLAAIGIDRDALEQWMRRMPSERPTGSLDEQPERRDVAATVLAWESGLAEIVTLPLASGWATRCGSSLLVDETTRRDPARYVDVLLAYAGDALPRIT